MLYRSGSNLFKQNPTLSFIIHPCINGVAFNTNMWYNMADSFGCVVNYWILSFTVYIIKKIILKQRECKKQ